MFYQAHQPAYPLSYFIEQLWYHADYDPAYRASG